MVWFVVDTIQELISKCNDIGWGTIAIIVLLFIVAVPNIYKTFCNFFSTFGIETKWSRREKQEMQDIEYLKSEMNEYKENRVHDRKQSIEIQKQLTDNLQDLKDSLLELKQLFIRKEIEDMRWELLDFANAVINGRKYNKEQYDHVLETYTDYERILAENNMENGRVDISMAFVKKRYAELMENGFDKWYRWVVERVGSAAHFFTIIIIGNMALHLYI